MLEIDQSKRQVWLPSILFNENSIYSKGMSLKKRIGIFLLAAAIVGYFGLGFSVIGVVVGYALLIAYLLTE